MTQKPPYNVKQVAFDALVIDGCATCLRVASDGHAPLDYCFRCKGLVGTGADSPHDDNHPEQWHRCDGCGHHFCSQDGCIDWPAYAADSQKLCVDCRTPVPAPLNTYDVTLRVTVKCGEDRNDIRADKAAPPSMDDVTTLVLAHLGGMDHQSSDELSGMLLMNHSVMAIDPVSDLAPLTLRFSRQWIADTLADMTSYPVSEAMVDEAVRSQSDDHIDQLVSQMSWKLIDEICDTALQWDVRRRAAAGDLALEYRGQQILFEGEAFDWKGRKFPNLDEVFDAVNMEMFGVDRFGRTPGSEADRLIVAEVPHGEVKKEVDDGSGI